MARKLHPDKNRDKPAEEQLEAEEQFKNMSRAYAVLGDEEKRARYRVGSEMEIVKITRNPAFFISNSCLCHLPTFLHYFDMFLYFSTQSTTNTASKD